MIHINSYKLTPAITATWGDITGNVSNQEDLVEYINEHGTAAWGSISGNISDQSDLMSTLGSYATESWVSSQQFATESWVSEQGYLTNVPSEYATQSWVSEQGYLTSVPSEYATQSWVSGQGYLTSVPSEYATQSWVSEQGYLTSTALTGYATESWVSDQGYLTEHQSLKTINDESLIGEGNIEITGSLTPEQEAAIAPLLDKSTGVLTADVKTKNKYVGFTEAPSSDEHGEVWVYDINNNVYMINWMNLENNNTTPYIYKWNSDSWKFELFTYNDVPVNITGAVPVITAITDAHVIWSDTQGRYYFNNTHTITFTDYEWVFTEKTMGGQLQTYNGLKSNIIKDANTGLEGVWMYFAQSGSTGTVYKFNEETQEFENQGIFYTPRVKDFYKYGFYYNGMYWFTYPNKQASGNKLYFIQKDGLSGRAAKTIMASWGIPSYVDVQNEDGTTKRVYVTGERIRTIVKDGETKYILYYGPNAWMLNTESTPYTWDYLDLVRKDTYSYYANGVEAGNLMFGFGSNDEVTGQVIVWNFSDKVIEDYGWDNSLDERLTDIEEIVPSVEVMTETSEGVLYTDEIEGNKFNYKNWFGNLIQPNKLYSMGDGSVYYFEYPALYKLNSETMNFEFIVNVSLNYEVPLWMDNSGRMYQGAYYEINLTTGFVTSVNLNLSGISYDRNRCNIYNGSVGIWSVSNDDLRLFNEQQKKFVDGDYTLTLPSDYNGYIKNDICHIFTYKGHKLFFTTDNKTYEVVDTNAGLTVTDVTGVYFPMPTFNYNPYFFFTTEDGNLWYMKSFDTYVYKGTTWKASTICLGQPFNAGYVVSGNCVFGGVPQPDSQYTVLNLGQTLKNTYWTPVNSVAVDIYSSQHILGSKSFDNIDIQSSGINYVYAPNGSTNINLGKNNTSADKIAFTVTGLFTLNGENIATTDKCFVNSSYTTSGPMYEGICPTTITAYYNYFKTPSGRLIYDDGTVAYEFDGTQFTQLQTVTVHPQINTFVTITDGLFAKDNSGNLIKWNDTTSDWEVLINLIEPESTLWAADANTLRNGPKYKLDNTGGTYSWVDDPIVDYSYIGHTYFIGQNVYMMIEGSNNMVYQYDESTKTSTFIGTTNNWPNGSHWFVFENGLYYFGSDSVHKIDPSQAGTDQWDVNTNILYTDCEALYVDYNNKLYLTNSNVTNSFGYCYDITEIAPVVPSTNGTYVLKAVRSGDQVTFSWVLES